MIERELNNTTVTGTPNMVSDYLLVTEEAVENCPRCGKTMVGWHNDSLICSCGCVKVRGWPDVVS